MEVLEHFTLAEERAKSGGHKKYKCKHCDHKPIRAGPIKDYPLLVNHMAKHPNAKIPVPDYVVALTVPKIQGGKGKTDVVKTETPVYPDVPKLVSAKGAKADLRERQLDEGDGGVGMPEL